MRESSVKLVAGVFACARALGLVAGNLAAFSHLACARVPELVADVVVCVRVLGLVASIFTFFSRLCEGFIGNSLPVCTNFCILFAEPR